MEELLHYGYEPRSEVFSGKMNIVMFLNEVGDVSPHAFMVWKSNIHLDSISVLLDRFGESVWYNREVREACFVLARIELDKAVSLVLFVNLVNVEGAGLSASKSCQSK